MRLGFWTSSDNGIKCVPMLASQGLPVAVFPGEFRAGSE